MSKTSTLSNEEATYRLELAEAELTFLKSIFDEYKDSSAELEDELDGQLKDLERSNDSLKRENEQLRSQLQLTISRSKKGADEATMLTTALENHLELLSTREKKAVAQCRTLQAENEELKHKLEHAISEAEKNALNSAAQLESKAAISVEALERLNQELQKSKEDIKKIRTEKQEKDRQIHETRSTIFNVRKRAEKIFTLTQSRFATYPAAQEVPILSPEEDTDFQGITIDVQSLLESLNQIEELLSQTHMSILLIDEVCKSLHTTNDESKKLIGDSEHAINASCLIIIGKIMVLGESLPEFRFPVGKIKDQLRQYNNGEIKDPSNINELADTILGLCHEIMSATFEPMTNKQAKAEELEKLKEDALTKISLARAEGEKKAFEEAQARLVKEREENQKKIKAIQEIQSSTSLDLEEARKEVERIKKETETKLETARSEANKLAEKARREALEQAALEKKKLEDEIYKITAVQMDALKSALQTTENQYRQATRQSEMYQQSMQRVILEKSKFMLQEMKTTRNQLEILKRSTQSELAQTQSVLNENLNVVRKVARTIGKTDVAQLSMMYERELEMRVKLQDQVQSLKGNIRVFCRIRPLIEKEMEMGEREAIKITDEMTVTAEDPDQPGKPVEFHFDRVFGPSEDQQTIFDEVRTLCLSALDGYNVCLFAYGITGSGKTFTVEGGGEGARDNPKLHGLVYRTIREIFRIAYGERAGAYETEIHAQLLELYNDNFKDLLNDDEKAIKPEVRIIPNLGVVVEPVLKVPVKKLDEAISYIKKGYINRKTSSTESNSKSSRSHSILTLYLNGRNLRTNKTYNGKLHFVDLAGSERLDKSGVSGIGKEEAISINSSLTALGDVIQALSKKEKFVPYRNSELTKLLQESLGGNSKTVMFINISPGKNTMPETISSLRFATRAHQVEMGKATKNESTVTSQEVTQIKNKMADLESKFKAGSNIKTIPPVLPSPRLNSSSTSTTTMKPPLKGGVNKK